MENPGTRKLLVLSAVVIMGATAFTGCFGGPPPPPPINLPPSATGTASSTLVAAGSSVDFKATGLDLDGTITTWKWDFGDESNATGQNVSHPFAHQGSYYVTLNVTDNAGASYDTRASGSLLKVTVLPNFPPATTPEDQPLAALTLWSASAAVSPGTAISWNALTSRGSWNFENHTPVVVTYLMSYGDGATDTKSNSTLTSVPPTWDGNFTHTYATAGKFAAKLTVTNDLGKTDMAYWDVLVTAAAPTPGVKNRDTMIIQSFGQPNNLDPAIAYDDASGAVLQAVYETLITYEGQKADSFVPLLADAVPSATNGLITNGNLTAGVPGAGIVNFGDLTLDRVKVTANQVTYATDSVNPAPQGGGIVNPGTLTLKRSTVSGNTVTATQTIISQGQTVVYAGRATLTPGDPL